MRTTIQDVMDIRVIMVLGLAVTCGMEGCSVPHSLSLFLITGRKTHNSLQCLLCLAKKAPSQGNYTFILTRNGKAVKISQMMGRKIWYALDNKNNNTGLWRCNVQEFPDLSAKYYLGPPTPVPPAENEKGTEEVSVPASTLSTRMLMTIVIAALLLIILIIVISFTLGIYIMKQRRRTSGPGQPQKDGERSDNAPLTETVGSDLSSPKRETDTEVSYVELEIIQDPSRKPSQSHDTIYANLM